MLLNSPVLPNFIRGFALVALAAFSLNVSAEHHGDAMEKSEAAVEDAMDAGEHKDKMKMKSHAEEGAMDHDKELTPADLDEDAVKEMKSKMSEKKKMTAEVPEG